MGTWTLNVAKSSPNGPKSSTVQIDAVPSGIRVISTSVNAAGTQTKTEYTAKYDGIEVPVTGAAPGASAAVTRIDDRSFEVITRAQGATTYSRNEISPDGKTRTATQKLVIGTREATVVLVYDKGPEKKSQMASTTELLQGTLDC